MKMFMVIPVGATLLGAVGCGFGQLPEAEARRLVEAQDEFVHGATCSVPVLVRGLVDDGRYYVRGERCAAALEAAGMARAGECRQGVCEVLYPETAQPHGNNMLFRCGTFSLVSVSGIATEGNTATFRYERDLVLHPQIADASLWCDFEPPEAGRASRERSARRDDAGNWTLLDAAR